MCDHPAQSIPIKTAMVPCVRHPDLVIPAPHHPGSTSSRLHAVQAPRRKGSRSPRAGVLEDQSLYLLKLLLRILTQTCCSSTSYVSVRVSTCRNTVKRILGWVPILTVTISHCSTDRSCPSLIVTALKQTSPHPTGGRVSPLFMDPHSVKESVNKLLVIRSS